MSRPNTTSKIGAVFYIIWDSLQAKSRMKKLPHCGPVFRCGSSNRLFDVGIF